jgi:glycerol uptake facilitator-like aquaporin
MSIGTLQVLLNYSLAVVGLVGSFILLIFGNGSGISAEARLAFASTLTGAIVTWAFTRQTSTDTAKAFANGTQK